MTCQMTATNRDGVAVAVRQCAAGRRRRRSAWAAEHHILLMRLQMRSTTVSRRCLGCAPFHGSPQGAHAPQCKGVFMHRRCGSAGSPPHSRGLRRRSHGRGQRGGHRVIYDDPTSRVCAAHCAPAQTAPPVCVCRLELFGPRRAKTKVAPSIRPTGAAPTICSRRSWRECI